MAEISLTGAIRSAAGKYGDDDIYPTLAVCYYVQLSERMYFFVYDLAALLCFEISNNFIICAATHQLIPIVVVVVLTIWRGFRDRTPTLPPSRSWCSISPLVSSGTPLVRVVYRDGEPLTTTLSPKANNASVSCRLLPRVTR